MTCCSSSQTQALHMCGSVQADVNAHGVTGKSKVINKAIQDMGMGRYQWELFVLCGFGWFADK